MDKYFKAINRDKWKRNPQWPAIPLDDNTGTKAYAVYAVFEDEFNGVAVEMSADSTIDWGDGSTIETYATTTEISHSYDYATITAPILTYKDGRKYKPVLVTFTSPATNYHRLYLERGTVDFDYSITHWLDIVSYLGDGTTSDGITGAYRPFISSGKRSVYLERYKSKNPQTGGVAGQFEDCINLQEIDVPSDYFNYSNIDELFRRAGKNLKLNVEIITNETSITWLIREARGIEIQNLTANNVTSFSSFGLHSIINGVGDITATSNTDCTFAFGSTVTTGLKKIGLIDMPLLEVANNMFRGCYVPEVVFTDCSAITTTTDMFTSVITLTKLIMPGLTVGVSVNGNSMSADALDAFMTSVGTAAGTQTLDLQNNPGSATCDTTIATAKGWTVLT